jgi:hypothetical protein
MKYITHPGILLTVALVLGGATLVRAGDAPAKSAAPAADASSHHEGKLLPAASADPAWVAKMRAAYPLTTCSVSGDKLGGDMGDPVDFVYQQAGKPDRLIRFCCKDCIDDFTKEPAKYLQKIDEAAAAKKAADGAAANKH